MLNSLLITKNDVSDFLTNIIFIKLICYGVAGPVGPCGLVRFNTKSGAVPVIVAVASVPGAPVVTVPIVSVGVGPIGPVA